MALHVLRWWEDTFASEHATALGPLAREGTM